MKAIYKFTFGIPHGKNSENMKLLNLREFSPIAAKSFWETEKFEFTSVCEDNELKKIAREFEQICVALEAQKLLKAPAISFWFTFKSHEDVRGLFLPKSFLRAVSKWEPSIDIAIASY